MDMIVRPYHMTDIDQIEFRECDAMTEPLSIVGTVGYTFVIDNDPVAIIGCIQVMPGVGNFWAIISDGARGHGLELTKKTKEIIDEFFDSQYLHRAQALIRPDIEENVKWINTLGFYHESTMAAITPDKEDLDMYVMVRR